MKLLLQYLKPYKWLVALALLLAAINQSFSMLDPYFSAACSTAMAFTRMNWAILARIKNLWSPVSVLIQNLYGV